MTHPEVLDAMIASNDVKMRDIGVIAKFLQENYGDSPDNWATAAKELIEAQVKAGLVTFILDDLNVFIRDIRGQERT